MQGMTAGNYFTLKAGGCTLQSSTVLPRGYPGLLPIAANHGQVHSKESQETEGATQRYNAAFAAIEPLPPKVPVACATK